MLNITKKILLPIMLLMVASSSFYYVDVVAEDLSGQCPEITTTFFSDTSTTLLGGTPSVPTYDEHPLWTANIPGATWIWSSYYVEDPLVVDTRVFVKNFNISNTQSIVSASITLSADNTYKLFANGTLVAEDLTEFNYYEENRKTFDLKPHLQVGDNNLKFEITNLTNPLAPTQERNPAGLLYRVDLVTKENNCNGGGPVNTPPTITLIGANPATTTVGTQFVDPGATAFDQEDGDITDKIVKTGFVDTSLAGTYTLQYSVADSKGLTAATTRDVIVNPLPPVIKQCTIEIVSDQDTQVIGGGFSQATYNQHPFWTANIPGATWIWKTFLVDDPTVEEFQTFERTFQIASTSHVEAATLVVAADNSYTVSVNGVQIGEDTSEQNYFDENKDTYNVTSYINNDFNRLNFTVKNWAVASSTPESNPAGLLYKLLVTVSGVGENCDGQKPVNNPPTITLIGNNPMNIVVGTQFVDPGATAFDQEDGDITDKIVKTGSVNTAVLGSYLLHYLVTDSGGLSAQTSRTVIVGPVATTTAPTVSLSANPSSIVSGNSSTLTWTSTNANSCSAAWTTATSTSGTQVVSPTATTEYAISCVGNGGSASATTTVTVTTGGGGVTPTVSLSANPSSITAGATSTLTWSSTNMTSCSAPWTNATSTSGTQIVSPATTTEYAITCTGNYGTKTASTTISVTPVVVPLPTVSLSANPSSIVSGNSSTLTWTSTNANSCSAAWTTATSTSGTQVVSPTATTEYAISCVGNGGSASATTTVTVTTGGGGGSNNPSVSLSANPQTINVGATSTLTWTSINTNSCSAAWTTATSTSGTQVVSPATTTEYAITCTGSNGSNTASTTVTVVPANVPVPSVSLNADPATITAGNSSTLSWVSNNTNSCSATWTTATSTSGSQVVSPTATTEYVISCVGNNGSASATTTITVNPAGGGGGGGGGGGDGGGGGIGGRRRDISNLLAPQGEILGATSCAYLRDYLKMGWNNDPVEMLKLKSFLNVFEKEKLSLTTVFDRATFDAVSRFQNKYFDDILEPWGHKAPTGFVYILTKKKINEIYCNTEVILSQADKDEIAAFRALMDSYDVLASSRGYRDGKSAMTADQLQAALSDALAEFEQEGMVVVELKDKDNAKASTTASILKNAAVSVFSLPQLVMSNLEYVAILIVAIVGAYVITRELTGKSEEVVEVDEVERLSESPIIILPAKSKEKEVSTAGESGEIVIDGEDEVEGEIKIKN